MRSGYVFGIKGPTFFLFCRLAVDSGATIGLTAGLIPNGENGFLPFAIAQVCFRVYTMLP
jgi:hypothetical protein